MAQTRKRHTAEFKRKVALEALKGEKTLNELTSEYGVHATQIKNWKQQALEGIDNAFASKKQSKDKAQEATINELHRQLGQVIAERDWLQKKPFNRL